MGGCGNRADRFLFCEATYRAALDYYFEQGFTLIILGDAEELWEEQIEPVIAANTHILEREARFYVLDRYLRLSGNHDNAWESEALVRRHLDAYYPGIHVRRELLFELPLRDGGTGKVLLAHGHQGTLDADFFPFIPQAVLPYYRDVQNLTNFGQSSPSQDDCLRSLQDTHMYRWANTQEWLILIAGHTHRPEERGKRTRWSPVFTRNGKSAGTVGKGYRSSDAPDVKYNSVRSVPASS